jgi:hypothetical protein
MNKRNKIIKKPKQMRLRMTEDLFNAFSAYVEKHEVTKTKVIEDFLKELLVSELDILKK